MTVTVLIYAILSDYSGTYDGFTYDEGDKVHVMIDTVSKELSVNLYNSDDILKGSPSEGPPLSPFRSYRLVTQEPFYSFCDDTTLNYIIDKPEAWPYADILTNENYYLCVVAAPVCDLQISSVVDIVKASSPTTADGSLTVSATSTAGTIRFALADFDYATEGQTSGLFSSLFPGIHTVYAKDIKGCYDTLSINITVTDIYGEYYRLEFDDIKQYAVHKIDILKRGFSGDVTEVCGADVPIRISHNGSGEGKYSPLVGSSATVGLKSESNQQFSELFLADDRQFQVKYYRDDVLFWVGYIIPSMYEEPYIAPPYTVFFTVTDGIGDLKNFDFLNDVNERYRGDVSQLFVIKEILNKLNLGIDIRSGINLYEVDMDQTADDDPLTQAYVNTDAYYNTEPEEEPLDCDTVLQAILKPYGARLFQAYGVWWIVRTQEMNTAFNYRFFDSDGVYQSNSSHNPLENFSSSSDIDRAVPRDKAGLLLIITGYGKITITQNLGLRNNLLTSGEFEEDDLAPTGIGTQMFFKDWSIEQNTEGITYGLERVENGDSLGAFYMDFLTAGDNDYNILKSTLLPISASPTDRMKFSFQYLARPSIQAPWVRFGFKLKASGGPSSDASFTTNPALNNRVRNPWISGDELNEIYTDKFGEWVKLEFQMPSPEGHTHIEAQFFLQSNNDYDYSSYTSLPNTLPFGTKRTVLRIISSGAHADYYTWTDTNQADSPPQTVRPLGGGGAWILTNSILFDSTFSILNSILLDNVVIEYLPDGEDPDEDKLFTFTNSVFIKTNYEETVFHGDLPAINNAKNIYKNYLRLSDGTPTSQWATAVSGEKSLLQILLEDYSTQMTVPNYRIQSPIFYDIALTFLTTFQDQFDNGRKYIPNSLDTDVLNNTANIEMIELKEATMYEITSSVSDILEEVEGEIAYIPEALLFSVDGDVTDLLEDVSGEVLTIAEIQLTNSSIDISVSDIEVNGVSATVVSGSLPNASGSTGLSTTNVGVYDIDVIFTTVIAGQHITLTDSDGNVSCQANTVGSPMTFSGCVITPGSPITIEAADGSCP